MANLPHDFPAPEPSGILPNTYPKSHAVWTIDIDAGSGQRHGDAVMVSDDLPTPTPEPTPTPTPTPTLEPTPEPTPEVTPEPTLEPTEELAFDEQPLCTGTGKPGKTLTGAMGTAKGGVLPYKPYVAKWRRKIGNAGDWTDITEFSEEDPQTYVVTDDDVGDKLNFFQKIEDAAGMVKQTGSSKVINTPPALVVSTPVVTGQPIVGETLTCSVPTVTGGFGPYQFDYFWVDESNAMIWEANYMGNTTQVIAYDLGKMMKCLVTVTDKGWSNGETVTVSSQSVGPITQTSIAPVAAEVDSRAYDSNDTITTMNGNEHILMLTPGGGSLHPSYSWEVRQGSARLSPVGNTCVMIVQTEPPGQVQIQGNIRDDFSSDQVQGVRFSFYVGEGLANKDHPAKPTWNPVYEPLGDEMTVQCNETVVIEQDVESNYQVVYEWTVTDPYHIHSGQDEHDTPINLANMQRLYPEMGWVEAIAAGPQLVLHCTNPPDGEQNARFHLRHSAWIKHPMIAESPSHSFYTKVTFLP